MNPQQEASSQILQTTVLLAIEGTKLAAHIIGQGGERIAAMLAALLTEQNKTAGAVRLATLMRSGTGLEVFTLAPEHLKQWAELCKEYSVPYHVVQARSLQDGMVDLFIRPEDAARVNRMCERAGLVLTPTATVDVQTPTPEEAQALQESDSATLVQSGEAPAEMELDSDAILEQVLVDETGLTQEEILSSAAKDADFESLFAEDSPTVGPEPQAEPELPAQETGANPTMALPSEDLSVQQSERSSGAETPLSETLQQSEAQPLPALEWTFQRVNREWPLSHGKDEFTLEQRMQIHQAFADGLSPELVDKLAQPQLSVEDMAFLRSVKDPKLLDAFRNKAEKPQVEPKPSVKAEISGIRETLRHGPQPTVPTKGKALEMGG